MARFNSFEAVREPQLVENLQDACVVAVAAGAAHSMALTNDGRTYSWGWNGTGQCGHEEVDLEQQQPLQTVGQPLQQDSFVDATSDTETPPNEKGTQNGRNQNLTAKLQRNNNMCADSQSDDQVISSRSKVIWAPRLINGLADHHVRLCSQHVDSCCPHAST